MLFTKTRSAFAFFLGLGAAPAISAANCYTTGLAGNVDNAGLFINQFCTTVTRGTACYDDPSGTVRWDITTCNKEWMNVEECTNRLSGIVTGCPQPTGTTQGGWDSQGPDGCINVIDPNAGKCDSGPTDGS